MVVDYKVDYIQFPKKNINISDLKNKLINAMHLCYDNFAFSTKGYSNNGTSFDSLKYYKSGNCVALSMFIQIFIKANFNIDSHLILSSVPNKWRTEGLKPICHCALCVPFDKDKCYIIDCAFYMDEPILMNINSSQIQSSSLTNIHTLSTLPFTYQSMISNDDDVLPDTYACKCTFEDNGDSWCYYLNEIFNPDECLSAPYYNATYPKIIYIKTYMNNGKIQLSHTM